MVRGDGRSARGGRDFTADDRQNTAPVAIVNREFAKRYLQGRIRCGRRSRRAIRTSTREGCSRSWASSATYGTDPLRKRRAELLPAQGQFPFPRQTVVIATSCGRRGRWAPVVRNEIAKLEPQLAFEVDTVSLGVRGGDAGPSTSLG